MNNHETNEIQEDQRRMLAAGWKELTPGMPGVYVHKLPPKPHDCLVLRERIEELMRTS